MRLRLEERGRSECEFGELPAVGLVGKHTNKVILPQKTISSAARRTAGWSTVAIALSGLLSFSEVDLDIARPVHAITDALDAVAMRNPNARGSVRMRFSSPWVVRRAMGDLGGTYRRKPIANRLRVAGNS